MKRLFIVISAIWLAGWAYVGWRGYALTSDAHSYIDLLPPAATVPEPVLEALEAGQSYTFNALVWGAGVPLCLLLVGWLVAGFRRRSEPRS